MGTFSLNFRRLFDHNEINRMTQVDRIREALNGAIPGVINVKTNLAFHHPSPASFDNIVKTSPSLTVNSVPASASKS